MDTNDGNFREALRFRHKGGDSSLLEHLSSAAANATYLSPGVQNEIVSACGKLLVDSIMERMHGEFFTVLADETTDVAGIKQLSVSSRYVCTDRNKVTWNMHEDFLGFVPIYDATGKGLATAILNMLQLVGADLQMLRGQGYDGCSTMSGNENGVHAHIERLWPKAIYFHCASHRLNLALVHSSQQPLLRNALATAQSCAVFFSNSSKRKDIFNSEIAAKLNELQHGSRSLQQLCPTRWVESHRSLITFKKLFQVTLLSLDKIIAGTDRDSSTTAACLLDSITKPSFIVALVVLESVSALILPLSKCLQLPELDV